MGCPRPNVPNKDPKDWGAIAEPLRSRLWTGKVRARAEGKVIGLTSGARSAGQQWDLRHGRVPAGQECNPAYKGSPTTAIPGRSRHENTGPDHCAADMSGALSWLHQHAADLGIEFPVPGEAWHAQPAKKAPRWPIIPYGDGDGAPQVLVKPDPNAGRTWRGFRAGASDLGIYLAGGHRYEVSELQLLLGFRGAQVDGIHGPKTVAAWVAWQDRQAKRFPLDPRWKVPARNSAVTAWRIAQIRQTGGA